MAHPFVRFSLYFTLLYIACNFILYLTEPSWLFNMYAGWIWMAVLLLFMWAAVRAQKNNGQGFITLRDGVKQAWMTFVIGLGVTYIFQYLLTNVIDTSLLDIQKEVQVEAVENMARSMGLSEDKIQAQVEEIQERGHTGFSRLLFGYASLLVFGAIPSFILAAIMKKEPQNNAA